MLISMEIPKPPKLWVFSLVWTLHPLEPSLPISRPLFHAEVGPILKRPLPCSWTRRAFRISQLKHSDPCPTTMDVQIEIKKRTENMFDLPCEWTADNRMKMQVWSFFSQIGLEVHDSVIEGSKGERKKLVKKPPAANALP